MAKVQKQAVTREQVERILNSVPRQKRSTSSSASSSPRKTPKVKSFNYRTIDQNRDLFSSVGKGTSFSNGRNLNGTPRKTSENLIRADRANQELIARGEKPAKKQGVFSRVIDVLSRGAFGTAAAANANQEEFYQSRAKGRNVVESLGRGFVAGARDWDDGFQGKKKTLAAEVIQNVADNRDAIKKGQDPAKTVQGQKKLNPVVKHGGGFFFDVFADPTTYLGVGLISKAARLGKGGKKILVSGKEVAENIENTVGIANRITRADKSLDKDVVFRTLGADKAPVAALSRGDIRRLSPAGKALVATVKAGQKADKRKGRRRGAVDTDHFGSVIQGSRPKAYSDFSGIADPKMRTAAENAVAKEFADNPGLNSILRSATVDGNLTAAAGRAYRGERTIRLSGGWNDAAKVEAKLKDPQFSTGAKTTEESIRRTLTHEIGHQIAYQIPVKVQSKIWDDAAKVGKDSGAANLDEALSTYGAKNMDEFFAEAWAEFRIMGDKARPLSQHVGKSMQQHIAKVPGDLTAKTTLSTMAATVIATTRAEEATALYPQIENSLARQGIKIADVSPEKIKKLTDGLVNQRMKEKGLPTNAKELTTEMAETTLRNLSPTIKKEFKVRVGPASIAVPGVSTAAAYAGQAVATIPYVRKTVQAFNKGFRANAHIPSSLTYMRNKATVLGGNLVREYTRELSSVWDKVPQASREGVMASWKAISKDGGSLDTVKKATPSAEPNAWDGLRGAFGQADEVVKSESKIIEGSSLVSGGVTMRTGQEVPDVLKHYDIEIRELAQSMDKLGIMNAEANVFLTGAYRLTQPEYITIATNGKKGRTLTETKEVNQNRLLSDIMSNARVKDPALALHYYHQAVNKVIARREMYTQFGQSFGVPKLVDGNSSDLFSALEKQGYRAPAIRDIEGVTDMVFHPDIARAIEKIDDIFTSPRDTDSVLHQFDRAQQAFKGVVTKYNPSFHTRTLLGEQFLSYLGGIRNPVKSGNVAAQVLRGRNREFMGNGAMGGQVARGADRAVAQRYNTIMFAGATDKAAETAAVGNKVLIRTKQGKTLSADQIWHLYMNSGLKSGFASSDLVKGADSRMFGGRGRVVTNGVQSVTENVEDFGRMQHFIDILQNSKAKTFEEALQDATETVTKFHLDYTAVTKLEREVMTRLMPFYKWLRLSTPLMAEVLLTQPGKAVTVPKAMQAMSGLAGYDTSALGAFPGGPDAVIPEWLEAGVPIGNIAGNTNYWDPTTTFPLASSAELGDKNPWNIITPYLKTPTEYLQGKDQFNQPTRNGLVPTAKFGAMQSPQTQFGFNMGTEPDPDIPRWQRVAKFLSDPGIQPNTDKRMLSASMQEMTAAEKKRKELRDKKGGGQR